MPASPMYVIDFLPIWGVFLLTAFVVVASFEVGFRLSPIRKQEQAEQKAPELGNNVNVTLSLLAFMLAFVFGVAADRFNERRLLVVEEANNISTTYMRADFLPESTCDKSKDLLRQYLSVRLNLIKELAIKNDTQKVLDSFALADNLQDRLWEQAKVLHSPNLDSNLAALYVESLNETFNVRNTKYAARLYSRLPDVIWYVLFGMTALGMAGLGYESGILGRRNVITGTVVVVCFGLVMMMIADLERPSEGFVQESTKPLEDLGKKLGATDTLPANLKHE